MYVCPDCKTPLENLHCSKCRRQYLDAAGIPILVSSDPRFAAAATSIAAYDSIYENQTNVWESQGRTPEFLSFFSGLLKHFPAGRFLEIGCGEGFLLAKVEAGEKFAIDLSVKALKAAQAKAGAEFSVALAERLPFPTAYFDLVASVGVMEHFLDDREAAHEIRRVLKPGGHYVALLHVQLTTWERLGMKCREFVFPRPRPLALARWLRQKRKEKGTTEKGPVYPRQPIQNKYSTAGAKTLLQGIGLRVIDVIHTRRRPEVPLVGHYVVIYVAQRV